MIKRLSNLNIPTKKGVKPKTTIMGLFSRKSEKQKLQDKHKKLVEEAYKLSHTNRKASDLKTAEADELLKKIEAMD